PTDQGGAGFTSQWEASFVHAVRDAINTPNDSDRSLSSIAAALSHIYNGDALQRVIYTESHDEDANGHQRVPEEIWPGNASSYYSQKRSTLGAALVFTAPGIPMIFQGQEFLESGWWSDQTRLDWSKATTFSGILNLYRDLIHLRRNWFDNSRGLRGQNLNVFHTNEDAKVLAFHRWDQGGRGDDVVVLLNFANRSYDSYLIGFPRPGLWRLRFNSDWNGYSADFTNHGAYDTTAGAPERDHLPFAASVSVGPYTALIFSQDR